MMMMMLLHAAARDGHYINGGCGGGEIVYVNVVGKSPRAAVSVETGIKLNEQYRRSGGGGLARRQKRWP